MSRNPVRLLPGILLALFAGVSSGAPPLTRGQLAALQATETAPGVDGQAVATLPPEIETLLNSGSAEFSGKNYRRAFAEFSEAIRLAPQNAGVYVIRANAYAYRHDYRRAIADYDEAIRLKPDFAVALNLRGTAHDSRHDYQQAIADFSEAIRLKRDFARAYLNRGNTYYTIAPRQSFPNPELALAIADFDEAIRLRPDLAAAYLYRGRQYAVLYYYPSEKNSFKDQELEKDRRKLGYDRAFADFTQAIRLLSENKKDQRLLWAAQKDLSLLTHSWAAPISDAIEFPAYMPVINQPTDSERAAASAPPAPVRDPAPAPH